MRLWQQSCGEENVRAWSRLASAEYQDFSDFVKKYGHPFSGNPVPIAFDMTARFFEGIGIAVDRKIVDIDLVRDFWDVGMGWKKVKPIAEGLERSLLLLRYLNGSNTSGTKQRKENNNWQKLGRTLFFFLVKSRALLFF